MSWLFWPSGDLVYTDTKSLVLDGTAEYLNAGNQSAFNFNSGSSFTIMTWVKIQAYQNSVVISKRDGANEGWMYYLTGSNNTNDLQRFLMEDDAGSLIFSANTNSDQVVSLNTWYHMAVTYGGGGATDLLFYLDGTVGTTVVSNNDSLGTITNTSDIAIGSRIDTFHMDGSFYDVTVLDVELNGTEISEAYNSGTPIDMNDHSRAADIIGYWRMGNDPLDDATATTGVIKDRIGGFDATPVGTVAGDIVTDAP